MAVSVSQRLHGIKWDFILLFSELNKNITRPAWAQIDLPLSVPDKVPALSGLIVQQPTRIKLEMGITDNYQLKGKNKQDKTE